MHTMTDFCCCLGTYGQHAKQCECDIPVVGFLVRSLPDRIPVFLFQTAAEVDVTGQVDRKGFDGEWRNTGSDCHLHAFDGLCQLKQMSAYTLEEMQTENSQVCGPLVRRQASSLLDKAIPG